MTHEERALVRVIVFWDRWTNGDEKGAVEAMRDIGDALARGGFVDSSDHLTPKGYALAAKFEPVKDGSE